MSDQTEIQDGTVPTVEEGAVEEQAVVEETTEEEPQADITETGQQTTPAPVDESGKTDNKGEHEGEEDGKLATQGDQQPEPSTVETATQEATPTEHEATVTAEPGPSHKEAPEDRNEEPQTEKPSSPNPEKVESRPASSASAKDKNPEEKQTSRPASAARMSRPASAAKSSRAGSAKGSRPSSSKPTEDKEKPATPKPGSRPASVKSVQEKTASPKTSRPPSATKSESKPSSAKAASRRASGKSADKKDVDVPKPSAEKSEDTEIIQAPVSGAEKEKTEKPGSRPGSAASSKKADSRPGSTGKDSVRSATRKPSASSRNGKSPPDQLQTEATAPPPTATADTTEPTTESHTPRTNIPEPPPNILKIKSDTPQSLEPIHLNALNMSWSFGMNRHIPVLSLTDDSRKTIAYACAHTVVLYDFERNSQRLLQGHGNSVSCTCVSGDKRWLASGETGEGAIVIIWDTHSGVPVQTLFDSHIGGVAAVAMTPDAKYLATLSAGQTQTLAIWDWTTASDAPICSVQLSPEYGNQNYICFNQENTFQVVTNSEHQVIFYTWKSGELKYSAPPLTDVDFNKQVGKYSQTIFQSNSTRCLTATSLGNLVVWDSNKPITKVDNETADKKAHKLVKLQEKGINVLTTTDKYIVTGDVIGHVRFLDQTLKLIMWYQDINLGPINAVSFAYSPDFDERAALVNEEMLLYDDYDPYESLHEMSNYPEDATISARKLVIRDFILGTMQSIYAQITTDGTDITVIHRDHDAAIHALATHPERTHVVIGSYSGLLKVWDYESKTPVVSRYFERGNLIRCCAYDPTGQYLAVGFVSGQVCILDAITLDEETTEPFRYAHDAITHVTFSHDSKYLATADAEFTVSVFERNMGLDEEPWLYLGRNRAHYKAIKDVVFGVHLDSDEPRLTSLGEDRVLVEYNLKDSSRDNLKVLISDRIEQSAIPLCMTYYPPVTKEHFIVTANDQYKFKLYNSTTKMCRKTLLGPTYGTPLQKIVVVPSTGGDHMALSRRYMAYITQDKVGLHILPLDGNPHNSMALVAHPKGVTNIACSCDGKYVFTAGGLDATVHMWDINISALEAQSHLGGEDLIPFYGLLDGGRDGELFAELENYFYYAQIRSHGVNTMDNREVSTTILLEEVPFVMRAMGFYPSEQEIMDMLNEVKYSKYVESGKYVEEINLGDFIKLYINHRPAFGLSPEKMKWAFETLGIPHGHEHAIDRGELLDILQSKGEHMTEYQLAEYLTTLLGYNPEGGASEDIEFDPSIAGDVIEDNLPQDIPCSMFADELLGFAMYADLMPQKQVSESDNQNEHVDTQSR